MPENTLQTVITRTEQYRYLQNYYDRWQRRFLSIGALYDGFFGVLVFFAPIWTATFFHLIAPEPGADSIWLRLDGVFLIIMALLYLLAARDPNRYMGIVLVCIVGKIWSVGFYSYYCYVLDAPKPFMIFAGLDFVFFFLHIWALGPDRWRRSTAAIVKANLYP